MNDPLSEFLSPAAHPPDDSLRQDILRRTTRRLRWRRRGKPLGILGVAAVCGVGFLALVAVSPEEPPPPQREEVVRSEPPSSSPPLTAVALEWKALEQPEEAEKFYRQAADRYLAEGDASNATRCYGFALDESGPKGLEISTNDSWLLMAIKQARKKETDTCVQE